MSGTEPAIATVIEDSSRWTRQVKLFMVAAFGSAGATMGIGLVLGLQVYEMTRSEFALGLVGIAQFTPALVLVLLTGAVADRFQRARVFSLSTAAQAAVVLVLAAYAATEPTSATPIFLLVIVFGVARAFTTSAQGPLIADLVPREQLPWLIPRRTLVTRLSGIGVPVLAGALYELEPALSYLALAGLLLIAAIATALIPPIPLATNRSTGTRPSRWHEALEGWHFIRRSPILYSAISIDLFAVLFGGAVALLPALAEERLGVGGFGVGVLRGAGGVGAGLTAIVLARFPLTRHVGAALIGAVAVFGLGTLTLGVTTQFGVALIAMVVLSSADGLSVYIRQALVPLVTPRAKLGRVSAISSVSVGASNELGAFESGVAGELLGSARAVVLGGLATMVVAGVYAVWFPVLRKFDRFPAETPADVEPPDVDESIGS
jgi:MFS family permease